MGVKMIIISYENHTLKEDHMRQGGPVQGLIYRTNGVESIKIKETDSLNVTEDYN